MFEDGLRKVVAGDTTIEEVLRVTQDQSGHHLPHRQPAGTVAPGEKPADEEAGNTTDRRTEQQPPPAATANGIRHYPSVLFHWFRSLLSFLTGPRARG